MPYQRYLIKNGKMYFPYASGVSSSKPKDVEIEATKEKEILGGSIDNELTKRLNAINIKKPTMELKNRLMAVDPKKKLINFTI